MRKRSIVMAGILLVVAGAAVLLPWRRGPVSAEEPGQRQTARSLVEERGSSPARGELVLLGRVVDGRGQPVAGAEVFLAASAQEGLVARRCDVCGEGLLSCPAQVSSLHVLELLRAEAGGLPAAVVRSGADGRFRFERLAGASFTVWARAPGLGAAARERAAPGEPVELVLPAPRSLHGRVEDGSGRAVAGARIHVLSHRVPSSSWVAGNADGAFLVTGLGEGPFYVLAEADGFLPAVLSRVDAGGQPLQLVLSAPRVLEVSVKSQGSPVDARVHIRGDHLDRELIARGGIARFEGLYPDAVVINASLGDLGAGPRQLRLSEELTRVELELEPGGRISVAVVDEGGQPVEHPRIILSTAFHELVEDRVARAGELVMLGPVALGAYTLRATAEGFRPAELPVEVKPGETGVELEMSRGSVLAGRVLDEYGRPVPGISLTAGPIGESSRADAEGRFVFPVPTPGLYTIEAHHSEWGGAKLQVTAPASGIELQLEAHAAVEVTVEADGAPLEGADVVMWVSRDGVFRTDAPSGPDGRVRMRGLPPGAYTLIAEHPRYLPSEEQLVTIEEGESARVTVRLRPGARVAGEVVDEAGRPVAGAFVIAMSGSISPATSDEGGRFELQPLAPGQRYGLEAYHPRYEQAGKAEGLAGGPRVAVAMRERTIVRGRVLADGGDPIRRFEVDGQSVSSPDGRFEVLLSTSGDQAVFVVAASGFEPALVELARPGDVGDVVLSRAPELTGMVVDEGGAPVAGAVVSCSTCDLSVTSGRDGGFTLPRRLKAIPLAVSARKGGLSGTRDVPPDLAGPVQVVMRAAVRLHGSAYLPDGSPAAGHRIEVFDTERLEMVTLVTGADGSYAGELPPGNYRIPMLPGLGRRGGLAVFLSIHGRDMKLDLGPAPGTSTLTVRLAPEAGRMLWLVPGELARIPDSPIELLKVPRGYLAYPPSEEVITLPGLPPGRYTLLWSSLYLQAPDNSLVRTVDLFGSQEISLLP